MPVAHGKRGGPVAWILLASAVLANVTSNVMFRCAMRSAPDLKDPVALFHFAFNPYLLTGFAACGALLVSYLLALREIGLMVSYAVVISLSLVGISLVSAIVLNEATSVRAFAGIGLIVVGIVLIVTSPAAA